VEPGVWQPTRAERERVPVGDWPGRGWRCLATGILLVLVGCASGGRTLTPLGERAHQAGCAEGRPIEAPISTLLQVDAVLEALAAAAEAREAPLPPLLFSVERPREGVDPAPSRVRLLAGPEEDPTVEALAAALAESLRPRAEAAAGPDDASRTGDTASDTDTEAETSDAPASDGPTGFRLAVDPTQEGDRALALRPRWGCAPRVLNEPRIEQELRQVAQGVPTRSRRVVVLNIEVGLDGRPGAIRVQESSGDPILDRRVQGLAGLTRFEPALLDGVPVPVWVQMPFYVNGSG
jgi:TonB family protein